MSEPDFRICYRFVPRGSPEGAKKITQAKAKFAKKTFLTDKYKPEYSKCCYRTTYIPDCRKCFCRTPGNCPAWLRVTRGLLWENWFEWLPSWLSVLEALVSELDHAISEDKMRFCPMVPGGLQAQSGETPWWNFHLEHSGRMWCARPDKIELSELPCRGFSVAGSAWWPWFISGIFLWV